MEKAVDNIEAMFTKAEADLNLMQTKLEYQFGNLNGADQQQNPVKLMKKLKEVKDEFSQISQEASAIQEAQKEFSDFFKSNLLAMTDMLKMLESKTGQSPEADPAMGELSEQLSSLLGLPEGRLQPFVDASAPNGNAEMADGACASSATSLPTESVKETQSTDCYKDNKSNEPPNLADLRINGTEFIEVSEEEFLSVSELIRQRVKLEEVNKVYQTLWQFYKEEKNTGMLTPKEMKTMGLRVTGATGQAKLKVLRALKICQINKNGDVKLV